MGCCMVSTGKPVIKLLLADRIHFPSNSACLRYQVALDIPSFFQGLELAGLTSPKRGRPRPSFLAACLLFFTEEIRRLPSLLIRNRWSALGQRISNIDWLTLIECETI